MSKATWVLYDDNDNRKPRARLAIMGVPEDKEVAMRDLVLAGFVHPDDRNARLCPLATCPERVRAAVETWGADANYNYDVVRATARNVAWALESPGMWVVFTYDAYEEHGQNGFCRPLLLVANVPENVRIMPDDLDAIWQGVARRAGLHLWSGPWTNRTPNIHYCPITDASDDLLAQIAVANPPLITWGHVEEFKKEAG